MLTPCPPELESRLFAYLRERFGFDSTLLAPWRIYTSESARQKLFLGPITDFPLDRTDTGGILIARVGETIKPSTTFLQLFGHAIRRNIVRLRVENIPPYCAGDNLDLTETEIGDATRGFVLVTSPHHASSPGSVSADGPTGAGRALGCGLLRDRHLENQVPKANWATLKLPPP